MVKNIAQLLLSAAVLAGCAGGPIAIKSSPNVRTVVVDGVSIDVAQDGGLWHATHTNFMANNLFVSNAEHLRRRVRYRQAIEMASGCKVVDSSSDEGTNAMSASVSCAK